MSRTLSKQNEIADMLKRAGKKGCTNVEMSKTALRYGSYICTLRKLGYMIEVENFNDGVFNYTLISEPEDNHVPIQRSAFDRLMDEVDERVFIDAKELVEILNENGISVRYNAGTHQITR